MNKDHVLQLCSQICVAADCVVSVGANAAATNAPQLMGIRQAAAQIAAEVRTQEEVATDG
jgi:hypothetical protein